MPARPGDLATLYEMFEPRAEPPVAGRVTAKPDVPGRWRRFSRNYGWTAYVLPVLSVAALVAVLITPETGSARPIQAGTPRALAEKPQAAAPTAPAYTVLGAGTFHVVRGSGAVGSGPTLRYTVEIEDGVADVRPSDLDRLVTTTLADARSWAGVGLRLQRVSSGPVDFRISLTSSLTVRSLCGYELRIETSCYAPRQHRVVLNVARWVLGATSYGKDLTGYRRYMINHEVGHALGHEHDMGCAADGSAPVMMQQTLGLVGDDGRRCRPNPWPFP